MNAAEYIFVAHISANLNDERGYCEWVTGHGHLWE